MSDRNTTTSLWSIVESMQSDLERDGLDAEDVDAAIAQKLSSYVSVVGLPWWVFKGMNAVGPRHSQSPRKTKPAKA